MILDKNELFHKNYKFDNKIKIYIGKNIDQINIIKNILLEYITFLDTQSKKQLLGLDFEFNKGTIAMAQLNLDKFIFDKNEIVLLFDPTDNNITDLFRQVVLHKNLWIILHGAESLDLPYLSKQLVKKSKDMVKLFQNLIDTKYLCEYTIQNKEGRCKINYFLQQQDIISKTFLNNMLQNEEKMGPIYLVHVDVSNLSEELLLYSAYDVIFLPELIRKVQKVTPFIEIVRFTQINYMMKFNLLKEYENTKEIISSINNSYFPKLPSPHNKLIDIIPPLIEIAQNKLLNKIKLIPAFKKIIELIEKSYLYPIFINKNNLILINKQGKKLKELDLPDELQPIFTDLKNNITTMLN